MNSRKQIYSIDSEVINKVKLTNLSDNPKLFNDLVTYFECNIQPLYGDQSKALNKINQAHDRSCEIIMFKGKVAGVGIWKKHLTNEYSGNGVKDALELKTFYIQLKNKKYSGLCALLLLRQIALRAIEIGAQTILGLVSTKRQDSLKFFLKCGFADVAKVKNSKHDIEEILISSGSPFTLVDFLEKRIPLRYGLGVLESL